LKEREQNLEFVGGGGDERGRGAPGLGALSQVGWPMTHGFGRSSSPGLNGDGSVTRDRAGRWVRPLRIASSAASSSSVVVTWVSTRFSGFGSPLYLLTTVRCGVRSLPVARSRAPMVNTPSPFIPSGVTQAYVQPWRPT